MDETINNEDQSNGIYFYQREFGNNKRKAAMKRIKTIRKRVVRQTKAVIGRKLTSDEIKQFSTKG